MKIWICSVCQDNWPVVKKKEIWAVRSEEKTRQIQSKDILLFYVKGTNSFKGIFEVCGDWEITNKPEWADETDGTVRYPFKIKIKTLLLGEVQFIKLMSLLSFITVRCFPITHISSSKFGVLNFGEPVPPKDYLIIKDMMQRFSNFLTA